jgi:DNA polymerase III delta prime subunit
MDAAPGDPQALLERSLESGRIHSAYLLSGPGAPPRDAALRFARGIACRGAPPRPCEQCADCRRSRPREEIALDGAGRQGTLYRHVGDHPDLYWIERGGGDTRVRIGQIRALQQALRLKSSEGGRRAAVVADAGWLNQEAQNALLRLLEEPPPQTTLVLVATSAAGLLATVRSRCQRVAFRAHAEAVDADLGAELRARFEAIAAASVPDLLDWAEQYRGPRAVAAARVEALLQAAASHLRGRVIERVSQGARDVSRELSAQRVLSECRASLSQRNANPQMVAERALLALQDGIRA